MSLVINFQEIYCNFILGIFQTQPLSASCVLGNNKIICILTLQDNIENTQNDFELPDNFNIVIDTEESFFKNFTKKTLENFVYKLFE